MSASPGDSRDDGTTLLIDDGTCFGQAERPGRIAFRGPAAFIEILTKLFMLPLGVGAVFAFVAMLGSVLVGEADLGDHVSIALLIGWMLGVLLMDSWRTESLFDREVGVFRSRRWLLGRTLRSSEWPVSLFNGISFGFQHFPARGGRYVVRLHTPVEGYRLDGWLVGVDRIQVQALAERLHQYTGLPVLAEALNTGPQHRLDDLRNNAWLLVRLQQYQPVVTPDALPALPPLAEDQVRVLTRGYQPGFTAHLFAWFLAGYGLLMFLRTDQGELANGLLLTPLLLVIWLAWRHRTTR